MDIKSLLDQPSKLPTIPKVAQKLIESFSSEDVSINEIAAQLAADPALSAKLLRLANSAYFHVSRTIGTVDDALRMLGFVMVRNLVLGNGMVAAFRHTPGMDLPQFWRYNLYTACAARWLAGNTEVNADMVFTLGLMHGIGQLQMHTGMPAAMVPLDQQMNVLDAGRADLEKQELGFHYGDVSAELAKLWNFPLPLIDALRDIPQPLMAPEFSESAALVHLGAWRARTEVLGVSDEAVVASYPFAVGKRLGLDPAWVPALAVQTPGKTSIPTIPLLKELTEGLDAMLT
ncbi:MAG: HDOD domain-containing protein [Rhodoferax sp.]